MEQIDELVCSEWPNFIHYSQIAPTSAFLRFFIRCHLMD
ncbi:hypothetical protein AM1_0087 [Acaryochloris marina MBIC11017]|uniref:Uncharacterized protein n=1 Tax=Acaryochloris marina (strain MBIC 11017) TaxID=329726 RepID=B0C681_ACAM1|nr:hypothetical protein AM1_0087 [Acaryochloris marina MBIC11017]